MKKFLIYVDILGFKNLPKEIAEKSGIDEDYITKNYFTDPFRKKINEIVEREKIKEGKGISEIKGSEGSDSYVLLANDIQQIFRILHEISTIKIPHKDYEYIPMEIAVGVKQLDVDEYEYENIGDIINFKEIKEFLGDDIINPYKKYIKEKNGSSPKETFIVVTPDFYKEIENYQQEYCKETNYKGKVFYYVKKELIEREAKISDFLEKTGQSKSEFSGVFIDKIFVPPDEYEKIKKLLEKEKVVFITGTAGIGKTYLSIKLLWEYYNNKGYTPKWIPGGEREERKGVRKALLNIEAELKPKHIIYFEDPFGKVEYEKREDLEENIRRIFDTVKNKEDCFVVITSRKDVFEEFKKESLAAEEIEKFKTELNIIKPSYSYEKRKEILESWAKEKGCKWLSNKRIKNIVFDSIEHEGRLPTPFAIYNFVVATINKTDEEKIRQKIDDYSKQLPQIFAKEIKELCNSGRIDRVLFLSFIFVSESFEKEFVKQEYKRLKEENFEDFEKILKEEYRVKEEKGLFSDEKELKFAHPLYSQALPYILEDGKCKKIFCDVVKEASKKDSAAGDVAWVVANNFEKLPDDMINLLLKLTKKNATPVGHVSPVTLDDVINSPFESAKKRAFTPMRVSDVAYNFEKLFPDDVRKLFFELATKNSIVMIVAWNVAYNFEEAPDGPKKLFFELAKNDSAAKYVAFAVANNFEKLPEDVKNKLLFELAKKDSAAKYVAWAIAENFEKLPENVRNLLFINKVQKGLKKAIEKLSTSKDRFAREKAEEFKKFLK